MSGTKEIIGKIMGGKHAEKSTAHKIMGKVDGGSTKSLASKIVSKTTYGKA